MEAFMYDLHSIHAQLQDKKSPLFRTEQKMIHCLYCKLDNLQGNEDPLFLMWQNELEFTYGNLGELFSQNSKINQNCLSKDILNDLKQADADKNNNKVDDLLITDIKKENPPKQVENINNFCISIFSDFKYFNTKNF